MNSPDDSIVIESRVHLFAALAEAAETEHNLMCLYLFAAFSLKRSQEEGVSAEELAAIERWRSVILSVSLDEMTHLCLVSNLFSALGGTAHFMRPNFPACPGLYPAEFVMELAPFDLHTIEHFIFLERPSTFEMRDADNFQPVAHYQRAGNANCLLATAGDYKTVGALYGAIRAALTRLSGELGESRLFCGEPRQQVTVADSPLPGLIAILDLKSALAAVDTIITQGEGATVTVNSHFERFGAIKEEYLRCLERNPRFVPGRSVVRSPVMANPVHCTDRVWITHPVAARLLDLANAIYIFTLRGLTQVYAVENRDPAEKHELLNTSFTLMHALATMGEALSLLPASEEAPDRFAGLSFTMVRTLQPLLRKTEFVVMMEALQRFAVMLKALRTDLDPLRSKSPPLKICADRLGVVAEQMNTLLSRLAALQEARSTPSVAKPAAAQSAGDEIPKSTMRGEVSYAEGKKLRVGFDAHKCIHSRHCVTEAPQVFKADVPGDWIAPDDASAELLTAVIRACPSGALTYEPVGDFPAEEAPPVNVMRLCENGPYAFRAELEIDGKKEGFRATLCRCGESKRKPFCDHSHVDAKFSASGEPATIDDAALAEPAGQLKIERTNDGPLRISGNLEICAASGRTVLRTRAVNLCRCGHSKTKPLCDGSHAQAGFRDSAPIAPR
ncbi:MAG: ferritin-like domain-containing protein [Bdellovibrionota bacterium]